MGDKIGRGIGLAIIVGVGSYIMLPVLVIGFGFWAYDALAQARAEVLPPEPKSNSIVRLERRTDHRPDIRHCMDNDPSTDLWDCIRGED